MGHFDAIWEQRLLPLVLRLYQNIYLQAVRHAFFVLMPYLLVVSFLDIVESLLLDPWGLVMGSQGLNCGFWLTEGLTGEAYRQTWLVQVLLACRFIVDIGYGVLSALLVMALTDRLAGIWHADRKLTIFCALAAFLFMMPLPSASMDSFVDHFGERSFFAAFFVSFLSARLFSWLSRQKRLRLAAPVCMPKRLRFSLEAFLPALLTLLVFASFSLGRMFLPASLEELILGGVPREMFQEPLVALFYQAVVWFLWWCGVPGYAFTAALQQNVYQQAQMGNQMGDASLVFTTGFFEAGMIHVLALLIAICVFSRHETWRSVSKFCLPAMLFNVQEPFVFGLSVVLNPIFFLPYILAPLANTFVGWAAISWGIVPAFQFSVPWTMPVLLGGILGTHSVMGGVLQAVWLIMDIFIYAPFVIVANMVDFKNESEEASS